MPKKIFPYIYVDPAKNVARRCAKYVLFYLLIIILTPMGLGGMTACNKSGIDTPSYIPPDYLDCIELSPLELGDYYFNYKPLYFWLPTADEILSDEPIIMKNIEISEEMLKSRNRSLIKIADNVIVEALKSSDIQELKVGHEVDILGICRGISDEWGAVILVECYIEPSGMLELPLEGEVPTASFDY